MSTFPYDPVPLASSPDCFFAQLLLECSVEEPQPIILGDDEREAEQIVCECSHRATEDNIMIEEFDLWRGLEDAEEEDTCPPEPHLSRATSLRLEQERKISKFLEVFGNRGVDLKESVNRTYSPQKKKKIGKGKKLMAI